MKDYLKQLFARRDVLQRKKLELEEALVPVVKELNAVEELISISGGISYPRNGSIRDKILFVLKDIKEGSCMDISKAIVRNGDLVNPTSLKLTCSKMYNSGELKIKDPSSRTYTYTL